MSPFTSPDSCLGGQELCELTSTRPDIAGTPTPSSSSIASQDAMLGRTGTPVTVPGTDLGDTVYTRQHKAQYFRGSVALCVRTAKTYLGKLCKKEAFLWVVTIVVLGFLFIAILLSILLVGFPLRNYVRPSPAADFDKSPAVSEGNGLTSTWLTSDSHVFPRPCHSHNDYWRPYPLFSALAAGCTGIEADVWLSQDGNDLLVGHDRASLAPHRTLKSMYLDPLFAILKHRNVEEKRDNNTVYDQARGIFSTQPNITVVLMIDVKEKASVIWPLVLQQLEPFRRQRFLTQYEEVYTSENTTKRQTLWPGPLVVVGSGDMDLSSLVTSYDNNSRPYHEYHDTFLDAPLERLPTVNSFWTASGTNESIRPIVPAPPPEVLSVSRTQYHSINSYYASASFKQSIGSVRFGFSDAQLEKLRKHIRLAKLSNLQARYWDIPDWPINYRDYIWDILTREGVGMLSVDDVDAAGGKAWTLAYATTVDCIIGISICIAGFAMLYGALVVFTVRRRSRRHGIPV